jgi:hypothetical protein
MRQLATASFVKALFLDVLIAAAHDGERLGGHQREGTGPQGKRLDRMLGFELLVGPTSLG